MGTQKSPGLLAKLLLLAGSLAFSLAVGELALRLLLPAPTDYCVWLPSRTYRFEPDPAIMPGVHGPSECFVNSFGLRGDELPSDSTYRILTVGGSTTECLYLDQGETWATLLQQKLNASQPTHRVWVGNAGRSGLTTREHLLQFEHLLTPARGIHCVVLLVGFNDLNLRLSQDADYNPHFMDKPEAGAQLLRRAFLLAPPDARLPFHRRTAIWRLLREAKDLYFRQRQNQDRTGSIYITWRQHRRAAPRLREALPDLTSALDEYSRNLNRLIDLAQSKSVRLVFATQPALWKAGLPKEKADLCWLGGVGDFQKRSGQEYYAIETLATALRKYNEVLLKVCQDRRVECVDLAAPLPNDTTIFYDDCHFNENGAARVADALFQFMAARPPFQPSVPGASR